jgi:signal peptidase II
LEQPGAEFTDIPRRSITHCIGRIESLPEVRLGGLDTYPTKRFDVLWWSSAEKLLDTYFSPKGSIVKYRLVAFIVAFGIIACDQLSKWWVSATRPLFSVIRGLFTIDYVENTGAAFGIFQGKLNFLILISVIATGFLVFMIFYERSGQWLMFAALASILGGTAGNLLDRIRLRYVVDFLQFYLKIGERYYYWPSFNVADTTISVGVGLLILAMILQEHQAKRFAQPPEVLSEPE